MVSYYHTIQLSLRYTVAIISYRFSFASDGFLCYSPLYFNKVFGVDAYRHLVLDFSQMYFGGHGLIRRLQSETLWEIGVKGSCQETDLFQSVC